MDPPDEPLLLLYRFKCGSIAVSTGAAPLNVTIETPPTTSPEEEDADEASRP